MIFKQCVAMTFVLGNKLCLALIRVHVVIVYEMAPFSHHLETDMPSL